MRADHSSDTFWPKKLGCIHRKWYIFMILFFLFYQCIKYAKIAAKEEKELFKIAVKTVTELSLYDNQTK